MRKKIYGAIAFVSLLVIAFVVGSLIHGFEPSDIKAAQAPPPVTDTKPVAPPPNAHVTLVPVNGDGSMIAPSEQPMTSAPAGADASTNTDATALTSQQYAALSQQKPSQMTGTVDPRSLTGNAYGGTPMPQPRRARKQMAQQRTVQVQPVPEYQPVPRLSARGSARLTLTIDATGRVRDINVLRAASGDMGRLIGAVQSWRFRPAMDNGQPVPARFTVDINFND